MAPLLQRRPTLWVADVPATIAWCMNTLGFIQTACVENPQRGKMEKDGVAIVFSQSTDRIPCGGPQPTGSLYWFTNDVETLWQDLKDTPHIYYRLETFAYGTKEFAIRDGKGYPFQFGQDVQA